MHSGQNGQNSNAASPPSGAVLSSRVAQQVYGKHSGYRQLKAYQVAELLYDFTCRFCDRYIPRADRHHDQMVQAARSGYEETCSDVTDSGVEADSVTGVPGGMVIGSSLSVVSVGVTTGASGSGR